MWSNPFKLDWKMESLNVLNFEAPKSLNQVKDVVVKYNEEGMCKGFAFLTFEDESSVDEISWKNVQIVCFWADLNVFTFFMKISSKLGSEGSSKSWK